MSFCERSFPLLSSESLWVCRHTGPVVHCHASQGTCWSFLLLSSWWVAPLIVAQGIPISIPLTRWPVMTPQGPSPPGDHASATCQSLLSHQPNIDVWTNLPNYPVCVYHEATSVTHQLLYLHFSLYVLLNSLGISGEVIIVSPPFSGSINIKMHFCCRVSTSYCFLFLFLFQQLTEMMLTKTWL